MGAPRLFVGPPSPLPPPRMSGHLYLFHSPSPFFFFFESFISFPSLADDLRSGRSPVVVPLFAFFFFFFNVSTLMFELWFVPLLFLGVLVAVAGRPVCSFPGR